jgi:hypothetical protein
MGEGDQGRRHRDGEVIRTADMAERNIGFTRSRMALSGHVRLSPPGHGLEMAGPRARGQKLTPQGNPFGGPPRTQGVSGESSRAYQTLGHLLVAVAHAFVLMPSQVTGPTSEIGTSADAICGSILTSRSCHCFCLCVEEDSSAYEGDREEKLPCHGLTS